MGGAVTWKILFTEMPITTMRHHSWTPHPHPTPLIKGEGQDLRKVGRDKHFCQKGGINLKRGVDVEMRGRGEPLFLLLCSSVQQFSHIQCAWGESKVSLYYFSDLQSFELAMQDFHPRPHSSLALKSGIIYAFLIHSGSLQKMLTALFDLV